MTAPAGGSPEERGRLLPAANELSTPFWTALGDGRLYLPACAQCGTKMFPPRPACPRCLHVGLDWIEVGGGGAVYSVTVVHRQPAPGFAVPFALALVALDEGWTLMTHVVDAEPVAVQVGTRVELAPLRVTGRDGASLTLPTFRPIA